MSQTTADTADSWIRSLERDPLGAIAINQVTKDDLDAWKRRQRNKRITVRKRLGWLHQLLGEAGNPARADMPRKEKSRRRPLSQTERATIDLSTLDDELVLMILLTKEAMLRRSDACGLMHEDRDGMGIRINRVAVATSAGIVVKPKAKSDRGNAWVPLSPALQALIGNGKTGFVLGDGKRPMNPRRITNRIQHWAKQAGLTVPSMGPHAFRRTGGMELLERGVDIVTAAEIMRHDKNMLLEEYALSREDLKLDAMAKVYGKPVRSEDAK